MWTFCAVCVAVATVFVVVVAIIVFVLQLLTSLLLFSIGGVVGIFCRGHVCELFVAQ